MILETWVFYLWLRESSESNEFTVVVKSAGTLIIKKVK